MKEENSDKSGVSEPSEIEALKMEIEALKMEIEALKLGLAKTEYYRQRHVGVLTEAEAIFYCGGNLGLFEQLVDEVHLRPITGDLYTVAAVEHALSELNFGAGKDNEYLPF